MVLLSRKVGFISCSCSKILILLTFSFISLYLVKILVRMVYNTQEGLSVTYVDRNLLQIELEGESGEEKDNQAFIDIPRDKPKLSFSAKSTLEKLLEREQLEKSADQLTKEKTPPLGGLSGGQIIPGNAGLSQLKASLKDPSFVAKIKDLEDRRQDLYVSILEKRGQIVTSEDGSKTIVSYPQVPVRFPNNLERKLSDWTEKEKIWLNITHFPWPLDESCRRFSVTFGRKLPIVGLASYPSSGNTWIRYLIEGISGYYTGSMYNDLSLRKKGFYGEGLSSDSQMVLTVKTHGHTTEKGSNVPREEQYKYNQIKDVNSTAILVIRNPFAAILGHRHLDQGGHTGLAKEDQFRGTGWQEFVQIKSDSWFNFYSDWLDGVDPNQTLVLHYENIKINLRHSLRRILDFLNLEEEEGRLLRGVGTELSSSIGSPNQSNRSPLSENTRSTLPKYFVYA
ncbi:uncharacterized protein LOC111711755 [Eurytemora carolleeae]|uniref:uncharacterized protein LOC111711755 n=1 Tax=Eurytemora carolleeae TaxID=1294199 RepID=UPI000C7907CF|nr:uncharacterized protein LOC111711755 [Eurytemora carolleeae]|eukprot:XP_023341948.1 uncharacterized protein LOC111711755 [Eurytemora affinis]